MVVRLQQPVQHKHAWITANIFIFQKDMWAKHFQPSTLSQKWMPFIYNCDPTKPRQKNTMVVFILLMKICWPKGSQIWTCTFFQLRPWWDHACKFPFLQKEMLAPHATLKNGGPQHIQNSAIFKNGGSQAVLKIYPQEPQRFYNCICFARNFGRIDQSGMTHICCTAYIQPYVIIIVL